MTQNRREAVVVLKSSVSWKIHHINCFYCHTPTMCVIFWFFNSKNISGDIWAFRDCFLILYLSDRDIQTPLERKLSIFLVFLRWSLFQGNKMKILNWLFQFWSKPNFNVMCADFFTSKIIIFYILGTFLKSFSFSHNKVYVVLFLIAVSCLCITN